MLNKVRTYIEEHSLLNKDSLYLVALSGGADSVCLLRALLMLGYKVHCAHCNFHLRGEESDRDEAFCKQLCNGLGVPLHLTHFDTRTYSALHKVSIEMAARELRYGYFEQLRLVINAEGIVVAHHGDDNVETVLMNIIRGTGVQGLEGIRPRNGAIIRPLLCVTREEITDWLTILKQPYVTDSTNLVDDVTRNKIRLRLIPLLESINPSVAGNIRRLTRNAAEARKIIEHYTERSVTDCLQIHSTPYGESAVLSVERLLDQISPEQTLFAVLSRYGFSPQQTEQVYRNIGAPSGRIWQSATYTIASDRGTLIIAPREDGEEDKPLRIPEDGTYIYKEHVKMSVNTFVRTEGFTPSREAMLVTLDADKVRFPLTLRRNKQSDRFFPFGMKGSQLVSDFLTNRKRNYFQRKNQLLVEDADGNIVWLVGERTSQKAACSDCTINVLTLRYITDEE